jgi:alpha-L-fucosidase
MNGEAIYDTHSWINFGEGERGQNAVRFTVKGDSMFAIILGKWPEKELLIKSLAAGTEAGKVENVTLLGGSEPLKFSQDAGGLDVQLPTTAPCKYAYVLKINGLKLNPPTWTDSGNPPPK